MDWLPFSACNLRLICLCCERNERGTICAMDEAIENKEFSAPELDEASAFLREQIAECQLAIRSCFDFTRLDGYLPGQHWDAMKIAARLMQASATAACALKRLKGTESRHTVRVEQGE